jgi:hypothetical protein
MYKFQYDSLYHYYIYDIMRLVHGYRCYRCRCSVRTRSMASHSSAAVNVLEVDPAPATEKLQAVVCREDKSQRRGK